MATQTLPEQVQKLSAAEQRFVTFMARVNDLDVAADKAKITATQAKAFYKKPLVLAAIQRKQELVERESARLTAKATSVTIELIDNELLRTIKSDLHGTVKLRAIELGYRRVGLIRDDEFVLPNMGSQQQPKDGDGDDKPQSGPSFYRAFETRTTTTVHETRELHAPIHPPAKTIPAEPAPVARPKRSGGPSIGLAE